LYQRYADPLPLLDGMFSTGRLTEFVDGFIDTYNEEQEDKTLWELWLHRVFDKSFADFRATINGSGHHAEAPTQEDVKNIVSETKSILNNFVPTE
jgi:hypothetical protein